jgi:hypothetical protein
MILVERLTFRRPRLSTIFDAHPVDDLEKWRLRRPTSVSLTAYEAREEIDPGV